MYQPKQERKLRRYKLILAAISVALIAAGSSHAQSSKKKKKTATPVAQVKVPAVKDAYQFITVGELIASKAKANTLVSVEGYFVEGFDEGGQHRLILVDSVDRVISTSDADKAVGRGVVCFANPKDHSTWTMTKNRIGGLVMYTGKKSAERLLTEIPPKVRITGTKAGQKQLQPILKIEYMDDNGYFKAL